MEVAFEILKYIESKNRYWFTENELVSIWADYHDEKLYYDEITDLMKELIKRQPGYLVPKLVREIGGQPGKTPIDLQLHP